MKKIVMLGMLVFGFTLAASAQTDKPATEKKSCCKSKAAGETKADCHKAEGTTAEAKACCKSKTASTETKSCCKSKKEGAAGCDGKHEASEKKHNCADHKENK